MAGQRGWNSSKTSLFLSERGKPLHRNATRKPSEQITERGKAKARLGEGSVVWDRAPDSKG